MVVDDNPRWRRLMKSLFEPAGTVTECSSGEQAVSCFTEEQPDWVLMDISMGGLDGIEAASLIKGRDSSARILFVTQHEDPVTQDKAGQIGCELVPKDRIQDLQSRLREGFFSVSLRT